MRKLDNLDNKVMLVTGAARGLGAAISERLAASGAQVLVADVRMKLAEQVALRINDRGGKAVAIQLDVANFKQSGDVIAGAVSQFGRIDALVNNAGIDVTESIQDLSVEDWDQIMSVNLRGPFIMSKHLFPIMKKQGAGHVINIVSTAAKRCWANASAYHASKWGLLGFTHALHVEARKVNIKVTAMICGGMKTPFLLERFPDIDVNSLQDPADVAETIHYILCAPEGTVLPEVMAIPMTETSWP